MILQNFGLLGYGHAFANDAGNMSLNNVTITDNGDPTTPLALGYAIATLGGGNTYLRNSIVAHPVDSFVTGVTSSYDCDGNIYSWGYNIDSDGTCALDALLGDQPNVVDAGLLALHDNGGYSKTHGLTESSPAIDAGDPTGCKADINANGIPTIPVNMDQRGNIRVDAPGVGSSSGCDVGAVEFNLLSNGMLEDDDDADGIADNWTAVDLTPDDALVCQVRLAHSGQCLFHIVADNTVTKQLHQEIERTGVTGETYTLRLFATGLNLTGNPRVVLVFDDINTIGIDEQFELALNTGTYTFTEFNASFTTTTAFDVVKVIVEDGDGGELAVDDLSLVPY
jgi:hypothetical protein